jgi:hypothetical protein
VSDPDEIERKLAAIRKAGAGDLTVPEHAAELAVRVKLGRQRRSKRAA